MAPPTGSDGVARVFEFAMPTVGVAIIVSLVKEIDEGVSWTMINDEVLFFLDSTVVNQDEDTGKKYWSLSHKVKAMESICTVVCASTMRI